MKNVYHLDHINKNLLALQCGEESGLCFFYKKYFSKLFRLALRMTKDDCIAESIVQDAFFLLWRSRSNYNSEEKIHDFLRTQVKHASSAYFRKPNNMFYQNLLQLDNVEGYQDFLVCQKEEDEENVNRLSSFEETKHKKEKQLKKLNDLIPHLKKDQQRFLQLFIDHDFNYDRIAAYLGGITEYEVGLRFQTVVQIIRKIFDCTTRTNNVKSKAREIPLGRLNENQMSIFHLRYELQLSFEEISERLNLNIVTVRKLFIDAHAKMKQSKQTA